MIKRLFVIWAPMVITGAAWFTRREIQVLKEKKEKTQLQKRMEKNE